MLWETYVPTAFNDTLSSDTLLLQASFLILVGTHSDSVKVASMNLNFVTTSWISVPST